MVLDADEAISSLAPSTTQGNHRAAADAVVTYLNAQGGVAGRKVKVIYQETDVNSGTYSSQAQRTCERFTHDHSVFAAFSGNFGQTVGPTLVDCLSKSDTPLIGGQIQYPWDDRAYQRYENYLYEPKELSVSRWRLWVDALVQKGFFGPSAKVGVYRFDGDIYDRLMERTMKPALAAHGLAVVEEAILTPLHQTSDLGAAAGQTSNAVLRFRDAGITHVLFVAAGGTGPFLFMPHAESQGYRPRYSMTSFEKPDFVQQNVPKEQLSGLVGVGWKPMMDVDTPQDPGGRPGYDRCKAIFQKAGLTFEDRNSERVAMEYCDVLHFFKEALDKTRDLTTVGFRAAVDSMGTRHAPAINFKTRFASGRHYGAGAIGTFAFQQRCSCFAYVGAARDIP